MDRLKNWEVINYTVLEITSLHAINSALDPLWCSVSVIEHGWWLTPKSSPPCSSPCCGFFTWWLWWHLLRIFLLFALTMVSPLFSLTLYVWKSIFSVFSSKLKHFQAMLLAVCLTSTFFTTRLIMMSARSMVREAYPSGLQALGEKRKPPLTVCMLLLLNHGNKEKTTVTEIKFYIPDRAK